MDLSAQQHCATPRPDTSRLGDLLTACLRAAERAVTAPRPQVDDVELVGPMSTYRARRASLSLLPHNMAASSLENRQNSRDLECSSSVLGLRHASISELAMASSLHIDSYLTVLQKALRQRCLSHLPLSRSGDGHCNMANAKPE